MKTYFARHKRITTLIVVFLMIICSSIFLFACEKKETDQYNITASSNGSIQKVKIDNEVYYNAMPSDWYTFDGWYDGVKLYSNNPSLKITKNTPKNLVAHFATTGVLTFDRILNSFYNTYKTGLAEDGEYFNFYSRGEFIKDSEVNRMALGGFLNFENGTSQIHLLSEGDSNLSFIYDGKTNDERLLFGVGEKKIAYSNAGILTNFISSLPSAGSEAWNTEKIIGEGYYQFNQYFGINNISGFVEKVENSGNKSVLTLNLQRIFNMLKNLRPSLKEGTALKFLADILVSEYEEAQIPRMSVEINVDYAGEQIEEIEKISFVFSLSNDYSLNFGGNKVVIPKSNFSLVFDNLKCGYASSSNSIGEDELNSYPVSKYNMLNSRILGNMSFLNGDDFEVDDYNIEINADINPLALISYKRKGEGFDKIDWDKFGFLSLRINLVPATTTDGLKEQKERHNGGSEYLNFLIDTENKGAKLFVYSELYNPNSFFSTNYFLNTAYDIPSLLEYVYSNKNESSMANNDNSEYNLVASIFKQLLEICINFDKNDANQAIFDLILDIFDENDMIRNNLKLSSDGIILELTEIREYLRELEVKNGLVLTIFDTKTPIKFDRHAFGDDKYNITKLKFNFSSVGYGEVKKNEEGFYLNSENQPIVNQKAKSVSLIGINEIDILKDSEFTLEELYALVGTIVNASGEFIDGSVSDEFINNKNEKVVIELDILDIKILKEDNGKADIKVYLQIHDSQNPNVDETLGSIFKNYLGIPYGLFVYETSVAIA